MTTILYRENDDGRVVKTITEEERHKERRNVRTSIYRA